MVRWAVALAAAVVAAAAHAAVGLTWFLIGTCGVSDVADRVPAPASWQGRVCDSSDHWANAVPWVALVVSSLLAVVLAFRLWPLARWRWVGLTACLWLPLLVGSALAAPPDTCTPAQRGSIPAYACDTAGGG